MPELPESEQRPKSRQNSASKRTELNNAINNQLNSTRRQVGSATYYDIASTLLGQGRTDDLEEIFLAAARDGDYDKIDDFLLRRRDCMISVDVKDKRTGNTPLIFAAKRGHTKIVQLLLKHGADVTLRNYENQTALDVASSNIKTILLDSVERSTESWHNLLLQAAWQGNIKVVRKLLRENKVRDINCRNSEGLTPLLLATRDMAMLEKLGTQLNKPYHPAEVVAELLKYRCDIHAVDGDGKTCLHYASQSKAIIAQTVVQTIITAGPDMELQDKRLFAPIHCASQTGNVDTIETLIQGGSCVNSRGFAGTTPLHITAYNDHEKAASCLLRHGAQVTLTDDRGLTSLDLARGKKMKATLKEAWIVAAKGKPSIDLAPIRAPSREDTRVSRKGEVIFDGLPSNPFADMKATPNRGRPVSRHLSLKEKARLGEESMDRDMESGRYSPSPNAKDGPRRLGVVRGGRKPSPLPRVSSKERNPSISPDRRSNGRDSPVFNKNCRFRRSFDEGRLSRNRNNNLLTHPPPRYNRDSGINTPTDELENCLQNSRMTPVSMSPNMKRRHQRSGSDTASSLKVGQVAASCDPIMSQKGRAAHPLSHSEDLTSTPYLINVKPAQIKEDNSVHKTNTHAVVLDLERMGLINKCQSPMQGAPVCPTSSKVLPPTPTSTNENCCLESKTFNQEDAYSSKETSPRAEDKLGNLGGDIKQAFNSTILLLRSKTKYKEEFVVEESRPKNLKELLLLQSHSSGSEESNYGSISSRSSDSSKENNGRSYKTTNILKPVPQKPQDLKKNIRNFPKDNKKFSVRPNNKVVEDVSKKNVEVLKSRYNTPAVKRSTSSDKITLHSNALSDNNGNLQCENDHENPESKPDNSSQGVSQVSESRPSQISQAQSKSANESRPSQTSQAQSKTAGEKQTPVQIVKNNNSGISDNGASKTNGQNSAVVKINSASNKPMQVVSNKLISNVREEVNRQKSAKQETERKNSGKSSSLTHSIKQMINVAKSVVVPNSGSARQKSSVTSRSVDAAQPTATPTNKKPNQTQPTEFLRTQSGKTVYTDITNKTVENTSDKPSTSSVINIGKNVPTKTTNVKTDSSQGKRAPPTVPPRPSVITNASRSQTNNANSKSTSKNSSPATSRINSPAHHSSPLSTSSTKTSSSPLIIKSASMSTIQESANLKPQLSHSKSGSDSNILEKVEEQKTTDFKYKPASAGKPALVEILPADTPWSQRIKGVSINPLEPVSTPIIVNVFEQFEQPPNQEGMPASQFGYMVGKPNIERSKTQTSIRSRGKSARKEGKPASASSRTGGKKKAVKNKSSQNSDDNRPKSGKTKKRVKSGKRRKKSAADSALTKQSEQADVALISGIGWHVATSCLDKSDVTAVQRMGSDSSESSDSDDLDMPTPRHYRPLHIETSHIAEPFSHSPRFREVKLYEQEGHDNIPVLSNDGYPPMNLDVTQTSLPTNFDIENFLRNLNADGQMEIDFDQAMKSLASARREGNPDSDLEPEDTSTPEINEQLAEINRQILLGKLTPIPESPSVKSSHITKTAEAIKNFEQNVKEETLNQLLGYPDHIENNVRNSATDMVLGNTLNTSPKPVTSQPPSGKNSGRRCIERTPSSEKKRNIANSRSSSNTSIKEKNNNSLKGNNMANSRSSSNTSVKEKVNSASKLSKGNISGNSNGRLSCQSSSDFKRSTESLFEVEKRQSRESLHDIIVVNDQKKDENLTNERQSSGECLLDEQGNVSSRRERKFSESKSEPFDENIESAIEEILNNNSIQSNSTLKSTGSFRLSNRTDTITPADRQLIMRMTAEADNSPFHAGRFAESLTPRANTNFVFGHNEKDRLAESFTPRMNKRKNEDNPLVRKSVAKSQPHLAQSIDLDAKQTMAKILNSFKKMEIYVGDHKREPKRDVTKPEMSASVPSSAARVSVRAGTPNKAKSAGKFTEIKQDKMTPRLDDSRIVKSSTRVEDSRGIKSSSQKKSFVRQSVERNVDLPVPGADYDEEDLDIPDNETILSHLSSNSDSRAGSACTVTSQLEETIQWKKGNVLGKGAFGTVWCGLTSEGQLIAVKQIELNTMDQGKAQREYEKVQEEVELLKTLNHKNIVGYLGTSLEENIVSIFMQFVPGGSIASILARFGALDEAVFRKYTKQILEGVEYLHANDVIHRDIKGGNVMLMPNGIIKLIDFGCAKRLCINLSMGQSQILKSMKGTPYWMAPEVVNETGHGKKSDIWSVGCTVFEMATRKPPWADMNPMAAIFAIGCDKPVPQLPDKFSTEATNFVNSCLTRDQNKRLSATQLLQHEFLMRRRHSKK